MLRPLRRARRRPSLLTVLLLVGSLAVASCSDPVESEADPGSSTGDASGIEPPAVSPLTGLPVTGSPTHPVLGVKVDNSDRSAPQVGLGDADMVVEELVEGGITRLAAFYYDHLPEVVGPVRSMRATDIGIVQPLAAVLVASGGAEETVERVAEAGIPTITEEAEPFFRDTARSAPYNLFVRLRELGAGVEPERRPKPYLPFGEGLPAGEPATTLTVTLSQRSSSTFELRGQRYVNTDGYAGEGDTFAADTVLVLRVQIEDAGYLDPAGFPVPETRFTGRGEATIFHRGEMVRGDWVKDGLGEPVELVDEANEPITIPPGRVWIELVPADEGGLTTSP